ncbi:TetR/AcrR family transcriptional regulator [Ktedonobacter racemifer]|uniref:Transcriptional regulator, TetR family n=1 Tax=Ktedonobacter racemifer DSM 44963 TaxID=485913 RepID=D6TRE4_KTERA|nr:TetR/AcrR family transcriptional regulator [Ktedonobacter racemifer]EFH87843.1 transcriptional regulator, TetR family [Ktedonobacter racemifer DSM 44963]
MHEPIPALSLKERQRQQRKALILQATEEVLLEKDYYELSMDEIAARVGIAKGTLYLHFARKEDLVLAILEEQLQGIIQMLQSIVATPGSAQARLETILKSVFMSLRGQRGRLLYALFGAVELRSILKEHHRSMFDQLASILMGLIEEGKASGEFDPSLPNPIVLHTFTSMLASYSFKRLLLSEAIKPEELVEYVSLIYFRGIANPASSSPLERRC